MNPLKTILSGLLLTSAVVSTEAQENPLVTGSILHSHDNDMQLLADGRGGKAQGSTSSSSSSSTGGDTRGHRSGNSSSTSAKGSDTRGGGSKKQASASPSSKRHSNNDVKSGRYDNPPAPERDDRHHAGAVPPPPPPPSEPGIVYGSTYTPASSSDNTTLEFNEISRNHLFVLLGGNISNRHGFWDGEQTSGSDSRCGYLLGLRYELGFAYDLYLSIGAGYSKKNYEDEFDDNNYMESKKAVLDIPIHVGLRVGDDDVNLGLGVGPSFAIGLGGKTKVHWDYTDALPEGYEVEGSHGVLEFDSFGGKYGRKKLMAGIGVEINLNVKRFFLGYSYQAYFGHDYEPMEYEDMTYDTDGAPIEIAGFVNEYHPIQCHCLKIGYRIF